MRMQTQLYFSKIKQENINIRLLELLKLDWSGYLESCHSQMNIPGAWEHSDFSVIFYEKTHLPREEKSQKF